jgi:hypothetical protein
MVGHNIDAAQNLHEIGPVEEFTVTHSSSVAAFLFAVDVIGGSVEIGKLKRRSIPS